MSFIHDTRSVEQQRFFSGQRLFDTDLQGIEAFNREMRWLHNQSLHQPGIGNGFAVSGKKGDREVRIDPGYAIDDLGREIVLTSSRTIPVPPVAGDAGGVPKRYLLTVAYPDDVDLEVVERRNGLCGDEGATRLRVEPIFCWVPLNDKGAPEDATQADAIRRGRQLVLAEIAVRDCKLDKDLSITQRRNAKPPQQPYIACGAMTPAWRVWTPDGAGNGDGEEESCFRVIGLIEGEIDTGEAGFLTTPRYFARLAGDRFITVPPSLVNGGPSFALLDGFVHIVNPTPGGFLARVMVIMLNDAQWPPRLFTESVVVGIAAGNEDGGFVELASTSAGTGAMVNNGVLTSENPLSQWSIVWMGVEG